MREKSQVSLWPDGNVLIKYDSVCLVLDTMYTGGEDEDSDPSEMLVPVSMVKPTRCTNVSNLFYFGITLHVLDGLSVRHQEFVTVHNSNQTDTAVCLLAGSSSICLTHAGCCIYSRELQMMDVKTVRNT